MAKTRIITEGILPSVMLVTFYTFCTLLSHAVDTIRPKDMLRDNETLVSAGGLFELGFFKDPSSSNGYMGIWFKSDMNRKAVWVNRENPILDASGVLQIRSDGNLVLTDRRQIYMIVNSGSLATSGNTSATLTDSGNLVLKGGDSIIWQSFDYPSDTYLPGMKIGWFGLKTDLPRIQVLVSWMNPQNPTRGDFTLGVDYKGATKLTVWRRDNVHMDIGFWDGRKFQFILKNSSNSFNFSYISNENETYFTFSTIGSYVLSWLVMASMGHMDEYTMSNGQISLVSHSICEKSAKGNAGECLTPMPSMCIEGDTFSVINGSMLTSMTMNGSYNMGFSDCEFMCQRNCSCTAFASVQDDQTGCQLYYGNKNDLLSIIRKDGGVIYVRGDTPSEHDGGRNRRLRLILISSLTPLVVPIIVSLWCYLRRRSHNYAGPTVNQVRSREDVSGNEEVTLLPLGTNMTPSSVTTTTVKLELGREKDQELPFFSFSSIETATDYFATVNKLGEGGFGPVYKGKLPQGQDIAVKRLSKRSGQGLKEFKNEITLISKLQHRNLVRLLGCCIEGEENILVYEYMPNKSLDSFIFDSTKRALLDWRKRVSIIEGIAQGLLYLHKYSRLRIIHRDLKTSNILLDGDMNPKISDFGMARIFGENETRAKTNKIAGTYGYMSPEYAMDGIFSEKSDVFSFGIIVLEIVSGTRNMAFFESDHSLNLLSYAWNLWKEEKNMEFMDSTLADSCTASEVFRCLQLGLLCVQERAADRPTMSDVVSMLSNDTIALPPPKEPAFVTHISSGTDADSSKDKHKQCSTNDLTISEIYAR